MSSDASAVLEIGLGRGLSLEDIIAEAQAMLGRRRNSSAMSTVHLNGIPELNPGEGDPGKGDPGKGDPGKGDPGEGDPFIALNSDLGGNRPEDAVSIPGLPRYDDLGPLGMGGMGEVRRVYDRRLGRTLALKSIHTPALTRRSLVARFLEEAQATAQLQHPGIVPVYDLGRFPDGRLWFTMQEVSGQTLRGVIATVHAVSPRSWQATGEGWSLRRLVDALRQVCDAVAYAHSRGVVHRDLKPDNVMVGRHGEVMVLDWGLAKVLGHHESTSGVDEPAPVRTVRTHDDAHRTRAGKVAGTPIYMSPEQALGKIDLLDARSDVYSLGAILYQVLSGSPPYIGPSASAVLQQVRAGPPASLLDSKSASETFGFGLELRPSPRSPTGPPLPPALVAICERAMARAPEDRFDTAAELAAELHAWLDGAKRTEKAEAIVVLAEATQPEATSLRQQAALLRAQAAELLDGIKDWQPEADKVAGWTKEDEAAELEKQAELAELHQESLLRSSLTHAPDLPAAHAALVQRYRAAHAAAESDRRDPSRAETLFRQHLAQLPADHPNRIDHLTYLQGDGALTLVTDPPGAEVLLDRYVLHHRRLVPRFERSLGRTPLHGVPVPMGSYLCRLRHPDHAEVRYPVNIGRQEHWHGIPSGEGRAHSIPLPRLDELGPDDIYVPAGWFACGGDPHQERSLSAHRVWVDGRVFRRFPVTNRQYMVFLESLVGEGRVEEALRWVPRERTAIPTEPGTLVYGFDGQHFSLRPDADGDVWDPDWPVSMVNWYGATAYAAWEAKRTGQAWRLPGELAWEKAARGVDGRHYPWGDSFDPSWARMRRTVQGAAMLPAPIGMYPVDESPYGIREMAGGIQDWCADRYTVDGPPATSASGSGGGPATPAEDGFFRTIRGASWCASASGLRLTNRSRSPPAYRNSDLGFRLARVYP